MIRTIVLSLVVIFISHFCFAQSGKWVRVGTHDAPTRATKIFTGPGDLAYFVTANGIFVTTDGGDNWTQMVNSNGSERITEYLVSPTGALFGQSDTAYYCSRDSYSWQHLPNSDPLFHHSDVTSIAFDNQGLLYFAVLYKGLFRLNASNTTYTLVSNMQKPFGIKDMKFDRSGQLYLLTDSLIRLDQNFQENLARRYKWESSDLLYRTGDQMIVIGDSIRSNLEGVQAVYPSPFYSSMVVDSAGNLDYYNQGSFSQSTDFGKAWQSFGTNLPVNPADRFEATRTGFISQRSSAAVVISRDTGKTFTEFQAFNDLLTFEAIFIDPQGAIHAFDSLDGHWTSRDGGNHWSLLKQKRSYSMFVDFPMQVDANGNIYERYDYGGPLVESSDNGASFHLLPHPTVAGSTRYDVYPTAPSRYYSYSDSGMVSRSTNGGATWQNLGDLKGSNVFIQSDPPRMVGFAEHGSELWAASEYALYYSTNDGAFWSVSGPSSDGRDMFTDLWTGRAGSIFIRLQSQGYHWLSSQQAFSYASWVQCPGALVQSGDSDVIGAIPFVNSPYHVDELVRDHRFHTTIDTMRVGPDSLAIRAMALDSAGNLYGIGYPAASQSWSSALRGIYRFYAAGAAVHMEALDAPELFISSEGGNTIVRSSESFSEITVTDLLGRSVLHDRFSARQSYELRFPSGAYFIRVRFGMSERTSKVLIF